MVTNSIYTVRVLGHLEQKLRRLDHIEAALADIRAHLTGERDLRDDTSVSHSDALDLVDQLLDDPKT